MSSANQYSSTEDDQNDHIQQNDPIPTVDDKGHFIQRVSSIPLVKDSFSKAQDIANMTMIGRFALSAANATLNTMTQYATKPQPKYVESLKSYLQPHVKRIDDLGCLSLDMIQSQLPIINQPSAEIITVVKQPIVDAKAGFQTTIETVTHPAHVVAQEANKRLGEVVDSFENAVDTYLPETTIVENGDVVSNEHDMTDAESNQIKRAIGVMGKATQRLGQKVSHSSPIFRSRNGMSALVENSDYVQAVLQQLQFLKDTAIEDSAVYGRAAIDRLSVSITVPAHQATLAFTHLFLNLFDGLNHLKTQSTQAPYWLKQKLEQVLELVYQQVGEVWHELVRSDISIADKFKHIGVRAIIPLQTIVSYVNNYIESIRNELNLRVHYFGSNQKIKTQ
ncbi:MAG: hypothetical protein EXX96DRAFT_606356 [Benjaminiella poitrasii]|nr:MAG: hypothetical protein EXX96DRAFT_606356 [Benjaminiella poitrasii]